MNQSNTLREIKPGQTARVEQLLSTGTIRRRLLDLGLVENTMITCLGKSPCGDPTAFLIRGAVIALRDRDCGDILVGCQ